MKRIYPLLAVCFAAIMIVCFLINGCSTGTSGTLSGNPSAPQNPSDGTQASYVEGEVVVRLKSGVNPTDVASLVNGTVGKTFTIGTMNYCVIRISETMTVEQALNILNPHESTDYAEKNYIYKKTYVPNDEAYATRQYYHKNMQTEDAWNVTKGDETTIIAVVDTGVDGSHPEFAGRMIEGYDVVEGRSVPPGENCDDDNHGTHVAGITAATGDNTIGIAGMNWNAKIMPIRVLAEGRGNNADIAEGIVRAAQRGANVINLSLGGPGYSQAMLDAVIEARKLGVVVIAAMGNDSIKLKSYPASYPGVIAVGSTNAKDNISSYSTRGEWISVSAPGEQIYSTVIGDYQTLSGTSMASPQVAGLASLILAKYPTYTPDQVRTLIEDTADDLGQLGFDQTFGYGRINAARALTTEVETRYGNGIITVTIAGTPTPGIEVLVKTEAGVLITTIRTNDDGDAYLFDLPEGTFTVSATNYTATVPITITPGMTTSETLELMPD